MRGRGRTIELDRMINCLFGARYLRALAAFGPDRTAARSAALAEALCAAGDEGAPRPWPRRPGALLSPAGPGATAAALCRLRFPPGVRLRPRRARLGATAPALPGLGPGLGSLRDGRNEQGAEGSSVLARALCSGDGPGAEGPPCVPMAGKLARVRLRVLAGAARARRAAAVPAGEGAPRAGGVLGR